MSVGLGALGLLAKSTADSSAVVSGSEDFGDPVGGVLVLVSYEGISRLTTDVQINSVSLTRIARQLHGLGSNANEENVDIYVGDPPGAGSLSWSVTFDNTSDNTYTIQWLPANEAFTPGAAQSGSLDLFVASALWSKTVNYSQADATSVVVFAGSTAGFTPVSNPSGLTIDGTEEQGGADGGQGVVVAHHDAASVGAHGVSFNVGSAVVANRGATWTAVELLPVSAPPAAVITADDGTVQIGEAALDPAVAPGTELLTATPAFDGPITEVYII